MFNFDLFNKNFDKAIIWGHKIHSHTHSYVHNAFYRAFKYLGIDTYWFDDLDDISNFNFDKSIFITEGQVDKKIPLNSSSLYVLHNCHDSKYKDLYQDNKAITLQVYTDDVLKYNLLKIDNCTYYDLPGKCLYQPWATDLLPEEIENNKLITKKENQIWWVGTVGDGEFGNINEINPFKRACSENNITFNVVHDKSVEENVELIKRSYLAPTIVGTWQYKKGYIPCRIMKNISYGQMGITNSPRVFEFLDKKIIYNSDTYQLYFDAEKHIKNMNVSELHDLMDLVKDKHTYINRINEILNFIEKMK